MTKKKEMPAIDAFEADQLKAYQKVVPHERGDEFEVNGKQVKVVEVLEPGRLHVKNKNEPFDSFIVLESEIK